MKKIKNWAKKQAAIISLAMANVEKNAFSQNGTPLGSDVNQERRHSQGQLADSLVHGEITQEVMDLRWRTYKILKHAEDLVCEIVGYDEDGMPIVTTKKVNKKLGLGKIKTDPTDSYPLEMVVDNNEITLGVNESLGNSFINTFNQPKKEITTFVEVNNGSEEVKENEEKIAIHGGINSTDFFASHKTQKPVNVKRLFAPKFNIEDYTTKLNVRTIDERTKLLEFYVSVYPDEYNKNSNLFIREIKKAMVNPLTSNMLEIKEVEFITYKTAGADDFLIYNYEITSFDKIVEYNGHYLIKFLATVKVDGEDILEKHRMIGLDEKYENKTKKK